MIQRLRPRLKSCKLIWKIDKGPLTHFWAAQPYPSSSPGHCATSNIKLLFLILQKKIFYKMQKLDNPLLVNTSCDSFAMSVSQKLDIHEMLFMFLRAV